jgi:hypothetical protein
MFNIKNNHPFFLKKNKFFILFNIFIYIFNYTLAIISSFLSFNTTYNNNIDVLTLIYILNKKNILILYYSHIITSAIIIFHLYNEINRELFYLYNNNFSNKKYDIFYFRISYILLIISYIINISLSYIILKNNIYIYALFNSYLIINIIFRTYIVFNDNNYSTSILFNNNIHYINESILNYNKKKIECFIDYPKDVYI